MFIIHGRITTSEALETMEFGLKQTNKQNLHGYRNCILSQRVTFGIQMVPSCPLWNPSCRLTHLSEMPVSYDSVLLIRFPASEHRLGLFIYLFIYL